ncbi:unnamed protein product [Linum tenue]|uniref:Uncharacterized protein n=1 Tax=Linum tenue TaxID=586396 RepID=A0AAV0N718_9ROSI|nr:unnamed protein product [Linum tenue]
MCMPFVSVTPYCLFNDALSCCPTALYFWTDHDQIVGVARQCLLNPFYMIDRSRKYMVHVFDACMKLGMVLSWIKMIRYSLLLPFCPTSGSSATIVFHKWEFLCGVLEANLKMITTS